MATLKIGIIGCGGISRQHIEAYNKNPDVEVYALCDINEERVKAMGEKYGIDRLYTSADEMLKLAEIDAVSICTWNSAHAPCTIAALNAGKHVLCEKPMAMNAEEAQTMIDAAEKAGKLLMIGFARRYGSDCLILENFLKQDYFGEIYYAKATYLRRKGFPGGWFGDKSRSGGGPLIDLGVHVIDLAKYIMGNHKPVSVYGATFHKLGDRKDVIGRGGYESAIKSNKDPFNVEDLATAMIRFDNDSVIAVDTSFSLNIKKDVTDLQFFGTKGGAKLSPELEIYSEQCGYMVDTNLVAPTALDFTTLFSNEINHYVDCLMGRAECKSPAKDGLAMMQILDAIYESAKTGHEVLLK